MTACLFALSGCFSESDSGGNDDDDGTTGNPTDPTLTTTTVDPSLTTSTTTTSSDPTSTTEPPPDGTGTTDGDTTTDPTMGGCAGQGEAVCDDALVVAGELCLLEPVARAGGAEQIGELAIADIDGDGAPDLAFADGADGFVSIVANGSLQPAMSVAGMTATWSVDVGPLGGDSEQFGVVFGSASPEVYVVRFEGARFYTDPPLPAPGEFVTVRMADFDGDNRLDLIVGSDASTTVYVFTNDGAGNYPTYEDYELGPIVGVADLRVVSDGKSPGVGLALLTRDGRLLRSQQQTGGIGDFSEVDPTRTYGTPTIGMLAAGDLDADADTDLAVAYDGRAFVFRAIGPGYAAAQELGEAVTGDVAAAIVDVDNDGAPDVLLADPNDDEIEIYIDEGGGFAPARSIQVPPGPRGVGAADFNGDCAADVVALGPAWLEVAEANP